MCIFIYVTLPETLIYFIFSTVEIFLFSVCFANVTCVCDANFDMYIKLNLQLLIVAAQNRSPAKNHNGRDNTESIDMEMSDEDFDTMPEFQSNFKNSINL